MAEPAQIPFSEDLEAAYTYLYSLVARAFVDVPNKEFVQSVNSDLTLEAAQLIENVTPCGSAVVAEVRRMRQFANACTLAEYTNLFAGPAGVKVLVWESAARTGNSSLFQKGTLDVRAEYAKEGFITQGYPRIADDQFGTELSFMAALCTKAIEAYESGGTEACDRAIANRRKFAAEHLLQWGDTVAGALSQIENAGFWEACASAALALARCDCGICL